MDSLTQADAPAAPQLRERVDIPARFKWNLTHIFANWPEWEAAYTRLDTLIGAYAALQGTLSKGPADLLAAMKLADEVGELSYKVWYFPALRYDELLQARLVLERDAACGGGQLSPGAQGQGRTRHDRHRGE